LIGRAAVLLLANGIIEDGKAAAGSVKDCGVGQGCTLAGWGFLRLVGWQYRKINKTKRIHFKKHGILTGFTGFTRY
jgi:hypothetical protein